MKKGYKQTDVGVIPEEWEAATIGDCVSFTGGGQPPKSTFIYRPRAHYVRLIQIRDYKNDDFATYIPIALATKWCSADDVMIGRYGPPIFQILRGIEGAYNVALMKATPSERLHRAYLYYFLQQDSLFNFVELLSRRSSGQTGVDLNGLREYPLPLPPLPEQRAIAAALGDADSLITGLEELLRKKRDVKQATMQQLLTGKQRLPGFRGEWRALLLKDAVDFLDGRRRPVKDSDRAKMRGEFPYYGASGIVDYVNDFIFDEDLILLGEDGENILSRNCRLAFRVSGKIWVNNHAHVLRPKEGFDIGFLTEYLESLDYSQYNTGTAQPKLNKFVCGRLPIQVPPLPEQTAIAAVLSDMDAEIVALEKRLEKTRALKQGMMQELLTGRTRLG